MIYRKLLTCECLHLSMNEADQKPRQWEANDLIVVARIVKTRGLRGEVVADLLTDFPERFDNLASVVAVSTGGSRRSLQIEEHWFHGDRIVFKFASYDSIETAKELVGYELAVAASERVELPKDRFYEWELAGCRVETIEGKLVGQVREVMRTGGVEILVVTRDDGQEALIPMAQDICVEIDIDQKLIRVDPPEGLLEL